MIPRTRPLHVHHRPRSIRTYAVPLAWTALVLTGLYFAVRDVPHYAVFTAESFGDFWPKRATLVPHVFAAALAFLIGFLQFSTRLRRARPRVHRTLGTIYVVGTLIGAPTAFLLGVQSDCALCRPPLALLGVLWFGTTVVAYVAARAGNFVAHRAFMIRSFTLMNVFSLIRIAAFLRIEGVPGNEMRILREWACMVVLVLGTEIYLTWWPAIRRLRVPRVATDRAGVV